MLGRHVGYDGERRKNRRIWVCNPNERTTARDGADGSKRCFVRAEQGQAGCRSVGSVIFFSVTSSAQACLYNLFNKHPLNGCSCT